MAELESILVSNLRPYFLSIVQTDVGEKKQFEVIISSSQFNNLNVSERIYLIFDLINKQNSFILENNIVIVEAFNAKEMGDLIEYIFQ